MEKLLTRTTHSMDCSVCTSVWHALARYQNG